MKLLRSCALAISLVLVHGCAASSGGPEQSSELRRAEMDETPCTFDAPEGWTEATPRRGVLKEVVEPGSRENVVVRSTLTLREPYNVTLEEAIRAAKNEAREALGAMPDFELVRDGRLPHQRMPAHLLVYRYRTGAGGPVVLRFHALYFTGYRAVHLWAESQATVIDALHTPHREAGLHEPWMRPALLSLRCSR